jgi:hypothetical protein
MAVYARGKVYWYEFYFAGRFVCESSRSTSRTVAKNAEKECRRELETGFNNIEDVRIERVRPLEEVITDHLVGYRLRFRSATFAEYALGYVSRLLGEEMIIDIDSFIVLNADVIFDLEILKSAVQPYAAISMIVDPLWRDETMKVITKTTA